MKTNKIRNNRIGILFSLTALLLFSFNGNAQLKMDTGGNIGIGTTSPAAKLDVTGNIQIKSGLSSYLMVDRVNNTANDAYIWYKTNGGASNAQWLTGMGISGGVSGSESYRIAEDVAGTWTTRLQIDKGGNVGIGTAPSSYTFEVNGTAHCNNQWTTSDQQFKTNVDSISNALSLILQLKPRSYYFDTTNVYGMNFESKKQYGLLAQDVQQILPELVGNTYKEATYDTAGTQLTQSITYKTLNYNAFIAIIMKGIQEQQQKIDSLSVDFLAEKTKTNKQDSINGSLQNQVNQTTLNNTFLQNQIDQLRTIITSCCSKNETRSMQSSTNQTNIELNDAQTIVLEQNLPNPFAEQTAITYFLPDNTVRAQMLFYNAAGKLIQTVELTQKGKGILNVFASDLSNGIYTYSLVVDGKIIETKKMVKQ